MRGGKITFIERVKNGRKYQVRGTDRTVAFTSPSVIFDPGEIRDMSSFSRFARRTIREISEKEGGWE